jgi:hypothetical protein
MPRPRSNAAPSFRTAPRAGFIGRVAGRVAAVALAALAASALAAPSAQAATPRTSPDALSPLRVFISVVPVTPAPLVVLHEDERAHLDALSCERPAAAPPRDAVRHASSRTAPGGR